MNIDKYRVKKAPSTLYYIPDIISSEEEAQLIKHIYAAPKPKWTHLSNRKLQDYGGVPHKKGMIPEKIPLWLQDCIDTVFHLQIFAENKPNHVLINEYLPGQGIMAHTDGPLFYPTVATISCGSHTVLKFSENNDCRTKVCDVLLEPRSLVILQDDMYNKYLHSISEIKEDDITSVINLNECVGDYKVGQLLKRDTRISLTIRNVPKVCKAKLWNI